MATTGADSTLTIDGTGLTLAQLREYEFARPVVSLADDARPRMQASVASGERVVARGDVTSGINTGFGALASKVLRAAHTPKLQLKPVRSHACGTGAPLPPALGRRMMLLKANSVERARAD